MHLLISTNKQKKIIVNIIIKKTHNILLSEFRHFLLNLIKLMYAM